MNPDDPIVEEVMPCEDLPPGSLAGRRMIVRWRDGTHGEAVRFYQDEVLSPVDHVGRQLRGVERGECRVMSMFMTSNPRRARCPASPS